MNMTAPTLAGRDGTDDPVHKRLRRAIEKRKRAFLSPPGLDVSSQGQTQNPSPARP